MWSRLLTAYDYGNLQKMPKRRTVVYFNETEWEALKKMSEKTGAPVAELVRRAVAEWVAKKK
jgi:hypothetical protein